MCPLAGKAIGIPRMVAHCLLLETERDGLILVDSGFGTRDVDGSSGTGQFESAGTADALGRARDQRDPA